MQSTNRIISLVKKDVLLEMRQQYTLYGILLYVACTIFVIYLSMGQPEDQIWNGLFWVVQRQNVVLLHHCRSQRFYY